MPEYGIGTLGLRDEEGNPRSRDFDTLYKRKKEISQLDNPNEGSGFNLMNRILRADPQLGMSTPDTNLSYLKRMEPKGDNLAEEIKNMNPTMIKNLVERGFFGDEGKQILNKIYTTGPEYRLPNAIEDIKKLSPNTDLLGGYDSIKELNIAKDLYEQEEQLTGQQNVSPSFGNFVKNIFFMSGKGKKDIKIIPKEYQEELEIDSGNSTLVYDSNTDQMYAQYDSRKDAYADKKYINDYFGFGPDKTGPRGTTISRASGYIMNNSFEEDGKFYVKLEDLNPEKAKEFAKTFGREDFSSIAGQTVGAIDMALFPVAGLYTASIKKLGRGVVISFNEAGKLIDESVKTLQDAVTAGKITSAEAAAIQREGKAKIMLARVKASPSITKKIDKSGVTAGSGQKTEVGKYPNIFENLGFDLKYDRTGSYKPKTVDQANKVLSKIDSPYENVKILKDNILQPGFDKHVNKTLKQLKLNKDTYLTAKEIGLIFGLQNVEAWPKTMRSLTTSTTKTGEAAADAMSAIKKIDERGVGFGPGVKYHLGDTIDALKNLNQNRITRQANAVANSETGRVQGMWTRALIEKRFNSFANKQEKDALKNLKKERDVKNKGKNKNDDDYLEIDHVEGLQVSLMKNNMGRDAFSNFLKNKNIDIMNIDNQAEWTKLYDEFFDSLDQTKVMNTIYNIQNPKNFSLIPKSEQKFLGVKSGELTKTKVFDSTSGGLYDKRQSLINYHSELEDLLFLKKNEASISKRDLNYYIDTYGNTKKRKFAQSKEEFLKGVTKRINDIKYIIREKEKEVVRYFEKAQELEAKNIKIPNYNIRDYFKKGGRVGFEPGGSTTEFDRLIKVYQDEYGMELRDAVEEARKDLMKNKKAQVTTPEKDRIRANTLTSVGNPRENLYGFDVDKILQNIENEKKFKSLYETKEPDIPEGKFNPYDVARIIDREDEIIQKKRELGYLPVGEEFQAYKKRQKETAFNLLPREKKLEEIREQTRELLNPGKPTKLKLSETGKLITQNPLIRLGAGNMLAVQTAPMVALKAFADDITGMLEGKGEGFDDVKKIVPTLYKVSRTFQPKFSEQEYISVIDEVNKMQDAGISNIGFGFLDLLALGIDAMADTNVQQKVKDLYDEVGIEQPETFLAKLGALGIELGVPGGAWLKVMNRARTALRAKGINTFVDKSTDAAGLAYVAQKVSNIAKRSTVLGSTFGVSDAVGMSRYSTVNQLFEDPLLLSDKESLDGLAGRELALANFRNRLRFGADGALIGGLFPLVGPPAWSITKFAAGEVGSAIGAVGKYVINPPMTSIADTLAGKSTVLTKAAEDAIAVVTGMRPELTGPIGKTGQVVSGSIQAINNFVGKQIVTRALLGAQDLTQVVTKGLYGRGINMEPEGVSQLTFLTRQLPKRKDWSMFSVNSYDPLKQNLARIDNVMGMFRDIGKLSKDAFFLSGEAKMFIKSNMRATEDYLRLIEDESYNLAQNFQKRYNKYGESKHIQNHYMDQVLGYLKGKVKLEHLAPELRETAKRLNDHLTALRKKFADLLPAGGMKDYMESNLREYMRKSFAMFTNPNFYPSREAILAARKYMAEMIEKDPTLKFQAELAFPDRPLAEAIKQSAELRIADFMETLRYEMDDPLIGMQKAAQKDLGLEDLVIKTGEELPTVLRKLLGEENNLKSSVLQTASSLSHQAAQKIALDRVAKLGLEGGWLFRTAEEARDLGKIINASQVKETGTGLLHTDAVGLYGAPEIVGQLNGFNMFDSILKNKIYHNLIAFKATVQGGKTLYSPATQARNFGSASLFALNQGHIGGKVSVGESFKMIMDDIFGPGKNADPLKVIENINRKIRLGVLDENIVAEELGAVLRELKGQQTGVYSMTGLTNKISNTQLTKLVQKMYAGGDNIWKWHGHEYVKSQLTGNIRSIDEISDYFNNVIGRKFEAIDPFTGKIKTVAEGIEEMAAYMIRETYPTYSRVPPVIQALRKFPFGNFISFPAEIMRTTFAATGLSLKHIASENPALRAMGYKGLLGQLTTLYGVGKTTQAISSAMTGIDERQMDAYTQFLGPEYMRFHQLIPITTKQRDGSFKAFDMSAYNPYDYMIAPIEGIIQNLERMRLEGTPGKIDDDMFNTMYALDGPLASLISPFIAETIGLEPFFDVLPSGYAVGGRGGITKSGSKVYDQDDTKEEKYNKSFAHILGAIAPGVYTTGVKVYGALQADISQGQQINLADQLFKLMGGSTIIINPNKALDYKVADIKKIRGQAYNTEHFFSESNWQNRPAEVLEAEFENIQDQAFRAQFEVYEMFKESLESGLLKKSDVRNILKDRGFSNKQIRNLTDGIFTPVTFSESAMEKRAKNIKAAYPGVFIRTIDLYPKQKLKAVIRRYKNKRFIRFVDPETLPERPTYKERPELSQVTPQPNMPVPTIPDTETPVVAPNQMANVSGTAVSPQTGLTNSESIYLSPTEQLYRRKERGLA